MRHPRFVSSFGTFGIGGALQICHHAQNTQNMPPSLQPLTARQLRWAEEFLVDGDGKAAAMRAGCRSRAAQGVATRYLANPVVMDYVASRRRALLTPPKLTRKHVTQGLQEAFQTARQLGNPAGMQAAAREIAQVNGFGPPDPKEVNGTPEEISQYKMLKMSDAELLAIIANGGLESPAIE
jgi:phage terminase small subunit